ncbi:MAG: hypothetical protein JO053_06515 [Acidobacteria bacterium]|nr:hypothetical protein [Acidobacteriota bacterium]
MDTSTKVKITIGILVVSIGIVVFWMWPYSDNFTREYASTIDNIVAIIDKDPTDAGVTKAVEYSSSRHLDLHDKFHEGLKSGSATIQDAYTKALNNGSARVRALGDKYPNIKKDMDFLSHSVSRMDNQ